MGTVLQRSSRNDALLCHCRRQLESMDPCQLAVSLSPSSLLESAGPVVSVGRGRGRRRCCRLAALGELTLLLAAR
jgi:hypothetical protein